MSTAGPELPPHLLAKRKRQQEDEHIPPHSPPSSTTDGEVAEKRRRVLGPSLPPAPLDELPQNSLNNETEDDSEDDFGPPPPTSNTNIAASQNPLENELDESLNPELSKKPQRDEWMLVPPKQDEWSSRVDPTKLRNRKFNTGKGAKAPPPKGSGDTALWTETPEQKMQRLRDEVMGVKTPAQLGNNENKATKADAEAQETQRKIHEYNEQKRNSSLYDEHQKKYSKESEDDPSKRAFDKEKDIGGGVKIGHKQRKEMLDRAANFGSRFSGGNYL